jgi:MFS transporter, UMF1 family
MFRDGPACPGHPFLGYKGATEKAFMSKPASRSALAAWCFYDWANSAYPTVIITFVFSAYVTQKVAPDPVTGTTAWGYCMSLSALIGAVAAPIFGAIADQTGPRKPWIAAATALTVVAAALLWLVEPNPSFLLLALVLVGIGNFAFETSTVFYNAMLPELAGKDMIGRVSGWGWGLGYFGGLACLALVLVGFVQNDQPWFGLDPAQAEPLRAVGPMAALWYALFALPLFFLVPDVPATGRRLGVAVRDGVRSIAKTIARAREHRVIWRYLIACMIYSDGLNTLFAFGGIYAAGTFGMDFSELILFGIALNVFAGAGAAGFAWIDDKIGPKPTILVSLAAITVLGFVLLLVEGKTLFWVFALPLGIFMGPAQAASRSMMAHLAPANLRNEMFGLLALSNKATAFMGPALLALASDAYDSQRAGMATILVFFVGGAGLLVTVPPPSRS